MPKMWHKVWNLDPFKEIEKIYSNQEINIEAYQSSKEKELMGLIFIQNNQSGILKNIDGLEEVKKIPEIAQIEHANKGDHLSRTEDLQSTLLNS